jgi:hypothetical protein
VYKSKVHTETRSVSVVNSHYMADRVMMYTSKGESCIEALACRVAAASCSECDVVTNVAGVVKFCDAVPGKNTGLSKMSGYMIRGRECARTSVAWSRRSLGRSGEPSGNL